MSTKCISYRKLFALINDQRTLQNNFLLKRDSYNFTVLYRTSFYIKRDSYNFTVLYRTSFYM